MPAFAAKTPFEVLALHVGCLGAPTPVELKELGCPYPHAAWSAVAAAVAYPRPERRSCPSVLARAMYFKRTMPAFQSSKNQ